MFRVGVVYKEEWPLQWESWSLIQISAQLSYRQVRCSLQTWINSEHHEPRKPNKYTTHCNSLPSNLDAVMSFDSSSFQSLISNIVSYGPNLSLGFLTWPGLGSVSSADFPPAKQPWLHRCMVQVQILLYFSADLGKFQRIFHLNYIGGIYSVGWSRMAPRKYEIIWNRPLEGPFLDSCRCTFQKKQMLIINTQNVTYMAPD